MYGSDNDNERGGKFTRLVEHRHYELPPRAFRMAGRIVMVLWVVELFTAYAAWHYIGVGALTAMLAIAWASR